MDSDSRISKLSAHASIGWPQPAFGTKDWPRISIVTPCLNAAHYLEATINSILCQGYPNLEYIIIDGGSTDGTIDIIRAYRNSLAWFVSEPDDGIYHAIYKGLSQSTGDVMGWLNSDDYLYPWALSTVGSIFSTNPGVEWISSLQPGDLDSIGQPGGNSRLPGFAKEAFYDGRYLPGCGWPAIGYIQQESTFWRRPLWNRVIPNQIAQYTLAGDFYLWSEFFSRADLNGVTIPLGMFRVHDLQKSRDMMTYSREAQLSLTAFRSRTVLRPHILSGMLLRLRINEWLPKLYRLFARIVGYDGNRLVAVRDGPAVSWNVEKYRFL